MNICGVIPARWGSVRFEGKVLASISGKPMIQHVWERAKQSNLLTEVYIACDDERIKIAAEAFGAAVVMTSAEHQSGTDRIAQAVESMEMDVVVNIQGDEPLIDPGVIDQLVQSIVDDSYCQMATVVAQISDSSELNNPDVVKVVVDQYDQALYFSRSLIPFDRDQNGNAQTIHYKHLGIYAYRKDFLLRLTQLPVSTLEQAEKLEQLRVLENGYKIRTVKTNYCSISVDVPEDIKRVEEVING